ncbi:MAG: hypothetical protein ACREJ0_03610 [Geminicoccaceae bacterium]
MPSPRRIYYINLCYEAYFCRIMEVAAENLSKACEFAMAHADDGPDWKDTLASSSHWIESVDHAMDLVPEDYSAEAIRCGGAELVAHRLHGALISLVQACERDPKMLSKIGSDIERAKAVLSEARI